MASANRHFINGRANTPLMEVAQLKRLKEMKTELTEYKRIVAEQSLQITVLKV